MGAMATTRARAARPLARPGPRRPPAARRGGGPTIALAALVIGLLTLAVGLVPFVQTTRAAEPDRSEVVLVMDFSASILQDKTNRSRFGAALEKIADRVDATATDLVAGDTTVSFVRFATRAVDLPGCTELKLLGSAANVAKFADCLRSVAAAYRKGITTATTNSLGIDTNYVAAMEAAALHLPATAVRPAMILFTDGKHDVAGVPVSAVQPALQRLFGSRTPFALLPVGMGLDPNERATLSSGLQALTVLRDMPPCLNGATFDWPQVVFDTASAAGAAVGVALQDTTCTFTAVAPTPTPTPPPAPAAPRDLRLTPGDGEIDLSWTAGAQTKTAVVDYDARCRAADGSGEPIESSEGVSTATSATVSGLTNGVAYTCEVAPVSATGPGAFVAGAGPVTPFGRPAAPAKPTVQAENGAIRIGVAVAAGQVVTSYHYECSSDQGATWPAAVDAAPDNTAVEVGNLRNGTDYACRAFAKNAIGTSDASPLSDTVRPCGSTLECQSLLVPVAGGLAAVLLGGILVGLFYLYRTRTTGYVIAVADVVHSANIGHGANLGIAFVRAPDTRAVTGIVAESGKRADIRIRRLRGGKFAVRDKVTRHVVEDGVPVVVIDSVGVRHGLVLQAFGTNAASQVARRSR